MPRISLLRRSVPVLAVLAVLAVPAAAPAAVTLGAPLNLPANTGPCDALRFAPTLSPFTSCTFFGFAPAGQPATWTPQTPRGQWVIVRVRVVGGAVTGRMVAASLRALRSQVQNPGPAPAACCTVNAQSQIFTPTAGQVTQIATRIPVVNTVELIDREPVEVVDYLGLKILDPTTHMPAHASAGTASALGTFFPAAVPLGSTQAMSGGMPGRVALIQADYEPDADGDGFGDETQDSCSTDAAIRSRPVAKAAQCAVAPPAVTPVAPVPVAPTPGAPGTAGAAAPSPGVSVTALRDLANFGSQRTAKVPIVCPAAAATSCTGSIAAKTVKSLSTRSARAAAKKKITIKAKTYKVRPGRVSRVSLTLPPAARKELRKRGRLSLDVTVTQTAPTPGSTTKRVTVRRVSTTDRASKSGRVTFRVAVPAGIDTKKKATFELRRRSGKKSRVARTTLKVREGRVRTVRLRLTSSGRKSLRRAKSRKLRLTLRATYRNDAGKTVRLSRTVTVRR